MDDIQYDITRIKNKLKELSTLHDKHLNRPTLDDNIDGEKAIDALTQEITQVNNISNYASFEILFLSNN